MIDLTEIIKAIFRLVMAIIAVYFIPWIKSKTTINQQQTLSAVVRTLVYAAEQMFKGKGRGDEKKAYVIAQLEKRGFTVDFADIEAEVGKMNLDKAIFNVDGEEKPEQIFDPDELPFTDIEEEDEEEVTDEE